MFRAKGVSHLEIESLNHNQRGRTVAKFLSRTILLAFGLLMTAAAFGQEQPKPAEDQKPGVSRLPIMRLDADGPVSEVRALAFSHDAKTLYAAGLDKMVYAFTRQGDGKFQFAPEKVLRIPIGPDISGTINAMAISTDGRYLAVGGQAVGRRFTGFHEGGLIFPASTKSQQDLLDTGTVYVFDLQNPGQPKLIHLRGHLGTVIMLAFAPSEPNRSAVLVSGAEEFDKDAGKQVGAVRVWDLDHPNESIAARFDLPAPSQLKDASGKPMNLPRAIAALRTGNDPRNVKVGIAWGDNLLRVWDIAGNETVLLNNIQTLACDSVKNDQFLVGGYDTTGGQLQLWRPPQKRIIARMGQGNAPIGLAKASQSDAALIISLKLGQPKTIGFFLADATRVERWPGSEGDVAFGGEVRGSLMRPAYAISPKADFVAVAGNVDRKIQVYEIKPNQPPAKIQDLEGLGDIYPRVRFYRKEQSLGLGLNKANNQNNAADLIFDLSAGQTVADQAGWNPAPANAGISAGLGTEGTRTTIRIDLGGGNSKTIVLPENQIIDRNLPAQFALCHATENHPPLLGVIVKSPLFAEAILRIYNAQTGERLRQFSGHTDTITSIAFSDDGKLLASAGMDRTIRAWWLEDLKDHIGQHGFLDYLSLHDKNDKPTIKEIDPFAADDIKAGLKVDDVIEGFTRADGTFQPTRKSSSFFYYLSNVPPVVDGGANTVKLRVRREGALLPNPPEVRVQQGVDERKPLFTLYFKAGEAGRSSWIGWTPLGPFDSSDQEIEKLVGWHINPARPADPLQFADTPSDYAPISQYRKDHYAKGMFKDLITMGRLAQPPKEPPIPDPGDPPPPPQPIKSSLLIRQLPDNPRDPVVPLFPDEQQKVWTEKSGVQALLIVSGIASTTVDDTLKWTLDGKELDVAAIEARPGEFEADLSNFDWKPKENNASYILRASFIVDADSPEYFREQEIVYAPKPKVEERPKKLPVGAIVSPDVLTVLYDEVHPQEIEVEVELKAEDDSPIQPGELTFEINGKPVETEGKVLTQAIDENLAPIKATLPLGPGLNSIRIRLKAKEGEQERLSEPVVVHYRRPPKVKAVRAERDLQEPRATITCELETPVGLPPVDFQIYINDGQFSVDEQQITKTQDDTDKTLWTVTAKDVPLSEGKNSILFYPRNAESRALRTTRIEVPWTKPEVPQKRIAARPSILFSNVNDQIPIAGHWPGNEFTAAFNIIASARLKKVLVYYNGKRLESPAIPEPKDESKYEFQLPVKLARMQNQLRVVALDENSRWDEVQITLAPLKPPVTVTVDELLVPASNNLSLKPKETVGSQVIFDQVIPDGHVVLRGRVVTSDTSTTFERPWVKCWVNGFLNWARAIPNPEKPTEWEFAVRLNFNKGENNRLHIELPEAPETSLSETQSIVSCKNPKKKQNLRVVVIGIDPGTLRALDTKRMEDELRKAFDTDGENSAFAKVKFYPLSSSVRAAEIMKVLNGIHSECQPMAERGEHDVVVVYYQGAEALNRKNEVILQTQDRATDPASLTKEELKEQLSKMFGAHLVFLDVAEPAKAGQDWEADPFLGVLRRVQNGPMPANNFPLASALKKAMPNVEQFKDLSGAVRKVLDNQKLDAHIPKDLEELSIR